MCYSFQNFGDSARCFQPSLAYQQTTQCPEEFILNPDNILSVVQGLALTKARKAAGGGGQMVEGFEGSYNYSESWSGSGSEYGQWGGSGGGGGGSGRQIVQVSPQRLNLKLRASEYMLSICITLPLYFKAQLCFGSKPTINYLFLFQDNHIAST